MLRRTRKEGKEREDWRKKTRGIVKWEEKNYLLKRVRKERKKRGKGEEEKKGVDS